MPSLASSRHMFMLGVLAPGRIVHQASRATHHRDRPSQSSDGGRALGILPMRRELGLRRTRE